MKLSNILHQASSSWSFRWLEWAMLKLQHPVAFPSSWSWHTLWSHPGTQEPQLFAPYFPLEENMSILVKRNLQYNLAWPQFGQSREQSYRTDPRIYLPTYKPKISFCQCSKGSLHREKRTEFFKKIRRIKEHWKLTGFPKLSVQGVIVHVRLNKGMVMEERTSVKVR